MAVRLRLRRTGTRNKPCYRIVAADQRSPRDGRFIETIGYYDPRRQDEQLDLGRIDYWLGVGAQPSRTVNTIIKRARAGISFQPTPKVIEVTPAPPPPAEMPTPPDEEAADKAAVAEPDASAAAAAAAEEEPAADDAKE